ncbi:SoxR reducing system RseC family protein [Anaerosalibacter bizertensis]|uniref:SoxR reducing system RseC family protein n=1 Tax=Anaerosalibacter bizertensis TaxID=932217 RepID=A0A844FJ83_9FIRM|nr:SoxR reducing system RseC family protein [Anaerosalibacter bizertensis]MBV1817456.1 SoxR reducing system RseC family protein [Bacteroidales bacterium MSK.15.36]HHV27756.1 SoxR reducing system RseC family protein [Tissierellia bacterium]MCB5559244.1 SoxR reducing system RseC family protein [Anaerosalibacter bizertensis]MCG4564032.1 SoxR reducing system RseC family protein [Anaerosalibacter bizertensis]MCG4581812.1 SoxR reducing system RseC family protein [Anaerosalibacter bizertensis]
MDQVGLVTKIKDDNIAEVKIKRMTACGDSCESCSGICHVPGIVITVPNTLNANVGDEIELRAKGESILKYAMITYMIPFCMLLIGIFASMYIFKSMGIKSYENYSFLVGLVFLAISYVILRKIDKKIEKTNNLSFEMVKIL